MASEAIAKALGDALSSLKELPRDALVRSNLGTLSGKDSVEPLYDQLVARGETTLALSDSLADQWISHVTKHIVGVQPHLQKLKEVPDPEYAPQSAAVITQLQSALDGIRIHWSHIVTAAVEEAGLLDPAALRTRQESAVAAIEAQGAEAQQRLQAQLEAVKQQIEEQATALVTQAKSTAESIEGRARETAAGTSLSTAQQQFDQAQTHLRWQTGIWAVLAVAGWAGFFATALYLLDSTLPAEWTWHVVYYASIRLAILGAIGTLAGLSSNVLRAHLHMLQVNAHRRRLVCHSRV